MAARKRTAKSKAKQSNRADNYRHNEAESLLRPDVGAQVEYSRANKPKPAKTYRFDSSLSPALEWDGQNPAREQGEALIAEIGRGLTQINADLQKDDPICVHLRQSAAEILHLIQRLKAMSGPFLNWAGKAERLSFDVPTLPLFVHERLSTKAIIETLKGHKRDQQMTLFDLFGDPEHSIADQALRAYEHKDKWVNRMVLGDSLVVMNSLLHYENLGGQVQMIYMDPPYGIKYGSNFQPFVRKRDVSHNDDDDMTREPETVQAYRDTWEVGVHSYLTYLRDRLLMCRELLHLTGSVFVQISDENLHHVRELTDETFGADNFCGLITLTKAASQSSKLLASINDFVLWYAKDKEHVKYRQLYVPRPQIDTPTRRYICIETPDGKVIDLSLKQKLGLDAVPQGRWLRLVALTSQTGSDSSRFPYEFKGNVYRPPGTRGWSTSKEGLDNVRKAGRMFGVGTTLNYKNFHDDFPYRPIVSLWDDIRSSGFGDEKLYVVQTQTDVLQRCILMTTDPSDLALDPTCGSGTTAYVAEQWGRRWITCDTSRVPLALARQRLLTATFLWYDLQNEERGPASGFVYKRKQNRKGEEVGGIVPHVTLKSIANNEPPAEEVLVDRPEVASGITRVSGPFVVEATIPTTMDLETKAACGLAPDAGDGNLTQRLLEVLRKSPILRLEGNRTVTLNNVRPPAKTLSLSAEAMVKNGDDKPVAFVFGPESGPVSEKLVQAAMREAHLKGYAHLYVIGFAIQPNARLLIEKSTAMGAIATTYVQATPDLLMGDLLKNMRSSQIFSVCGLPEIEVKKVNGKGKSKNGSRQYQVSLLGLDVFDPVTMEAIHRRGDDVPAWFLDTDYNEQCFLVSQAFFPRTGAWDNLKKALRGTHEESVWDHLAGTTSAPFEAGKHGQIAVKVIDDRGNELMVVKTLAADERR